MRVLVVDQNEDERVAPILASSPVEVVRSALRRGLSRARNVALPRLEADVVAFPDDDCVYPPGLLRPSRRAVRRDAERSTASPDAR